MHHIGPASHRCGAVFRVHLAVENRCWRGGFSCADRDLSNDFLVVVVSDELLIGEIDHKACDEFEHDPRRH